MSLLVIPKADDTRAFTGEARILSEMDGNDLPTSINSDAVKKILRLKKMMMKEGI